MGIARMIQEKKRYRNYKRRIARLPENYQAAVSALERYLMYFGPGDGDQLMQMLEDLADLFDQSAASHTPIRVIVGDDPVEFAEEFRQNYPVGQWIIKERERLTAAIDASTNGEPR